MRKPINCHIARQILLAVIVATAATAQTPSTDSQTLQALLEEVRQMRQDMKTTQRSQILIHRLQIEQAAVDRVQARLDEARSELTKIQSQNKDIASDTKVFEDRLASSTSPVEQKQLQSQVDAFKAHVQGAALDEQEKVARVTDCEQQLRLEQTKLNELEEQLNKLDTVLKNANPQ